MTKNILILSASPRKGGNSDLLCDAFARGAQESGHKAEKLFLREYNIHYCTGCGVCNTTHRCVQQDDMSDILDKMLAADVLVFATPVYFYAMDAQLKTLIDRSVPRYTALTDKEIYMILTAADPTEESLYRVADGIRGFTQECLPGAVERGVLYGTGVWNAGEVRGTPLMQEAYAMGKNV